MRTVVINTKFEYKSDNGIIVNAKDHGTFINMLIAAIKSGDDGICAWCLLDGKRLNYEASEKLKRQIQGDEYDDFGEWTEKEIQDQDVEIYKQ